MKKTLVTMACGLALVLAAAAVQAAPLSTTDSTFVGTVEPGTPANDTLETEAINYLLGMTPGDTDTDVSLPPDPPDYTYTLVRSDNDCATELGGCTEVAPPGSTTNYQDPAADVTVNTGNATYLLAKYGQVSYIWYVGDVDSVEVDNGLGKGLGLSHVSLYGSTSVPDGGTTAGLLGLGMMALGYLRRRIG
jgi:hypothetical protein